MFHQFRTMPHSLCSSDANALTSQMSVPRSTVWVRSQKCPRHFWRQFPTPAGGGRARGAGAVPSRLTGRDNLHRPKSFSSASAFPSRAPGPSWPPPDLGHRPDGPALPAPTPACRPKYAVFGPLSSSPPRSRAAPFFRRLDTLTVQDRRAGVRMTARGCAHLAPQPLLNAGPGAVQPPGAKIGVDRLPRRKVMGQEAPLAPRAQDIEDRVDNLSPPVLSWTPAAVDGRNQWFDDGPFFVREIRGVIRSVVHSTILPTFKTTF